ncbi:DGQHR domain-containing protein [Burkholderia vietnamiensis]|uniref:DGQHR domain-containing protein n=1 Tax=Burkholderia vietnamiensis TaxID=60552 RepID=UPI00075D1CC9|nr:DGQHR domain-containing protein [Burkholderia vietnamiensis]KVF26149.1 DNA phosphorothioation-associated DGQHR protein 1 [Burkholderia vietnamiensis]KVF46338.1 DNA phosphorothioation-associated DGQHR protein 1 [Burkholderia vietnamiensis]
MVTFPLRVPALRVVQPIGVYYVAVIPADVLLQVSYSDKLTAKWDAARGTYVLDGTQRPLQEKRFQQIAEYITRADSAFPNTIILAANFRQEDGLLETGLDETSRSGTPDPRWSISDGVDGSAMLTIPTKEKLAAIIDGQHRLLGFTQVKNPDRLKMQLICSVFLGLPKPFQAQLFATINSTQKAVDKSQTYELFGYNLEDEDPEEWSPDKLAVFITRKLGTDSESPLKGRVVIAAETDEELKALGAEAEWRVSTAVIVDGVLRLISSNPKRDTAAMLEGSRKPRAVLSQGRVDRSVLRDLYLAGQDEVLYILTRNYLDACENIFWRDAPKDSYITKTVGVQALLDVLRLVAKKANEDRDISVSRFEEILKPAAGIDFVADAFKNASGAGRTTIKRAIVAACGL